MDFKIILMPKALQELKKISQRIAVDDPVVAERFGNELIDCTLPLASFPEMGRVVPEFNEITIRELILDSYRIIYRVLSRKKEMHILRFWHAARGTPTL